MQSVTVCCFGLVEIEEKPVMEPSLSLSNRTKRDPEMFCGYSSTTEYLKASDM